MNNTNTPRKARGRIGIVGILSYARYAIAGGIGGIAVYNTFMLIVSAPPAQSAESIAMGAGAILATAIAKVLHVV